MSIDSQASERAALLTLLRDKQRRHHLAQVATKRGLAEQIREIRQARGWTQSGLAEASGKVQETISQLENPDYGSYTLKTLWRLAEAFDVTLTVRFDPFSELVRWMTNLSPEDLAVPDYEHDPGLVSAHLASDRLLTLNTGATLSTAAVRQSRSSTARTLMPSPRLIPRGTADIGDDYLLDTTVYRPVEQLGA